MELQNSDQQLAQQFRNAVDRGTGLGDRPVMAPTFENLNLLSASVGHDRLLETYRRQQADKRRVFEGTLLRSLAGLEP